MTESRLDQIRQAALAEADKSERWARLFVLAGGVVEMATFVAILFVIDWGEGTHLLIFLCTCLVYGPLMLGLWALRHHIDHASHRILTGITTAAE